MNLVFASTCATGLLPLLTTPSEKTARRSGMFAAEGIEMLRAPSVFERHTGHEAIRRQLSLHMEILYCLLRQLSRHLCKKHDEHKIFDRFVSEYREDFLRYLDNKAEI